MPHEARAPTHNRDRGEPRGSAPPTPPCVRVRTRRFGWLSVATNAGLSVACSAAASSVPFSVAFGASPLLSPGKASHHWTIFCRCLATRSSLLLTSPYRSGLRCALAHLLCPLLTPAPRSGFLTVPSVPLRDTVQASRGKPNRLHRTPAGFTATTLGGSGLCYPLLTRPVLTASYPVPVRQVAALLHASFRHHLAMMPLRFASTSPPPGRARDFHPQAVEHARHTTQRPAPEPERASW